MISSRPSHARRRGRRHLDVLVDGYADGSLSMVCYTLGAECPDVHSEDPAPTLPPPEEVPIDQSNL